ncbi:MAG: flagellin lysine-N-methylase, partial [Clostridia bacterium]|nr:flagellin lysine-N-methylase [Clostridia bacterium]
MKRFVPDYYPDFACIMGNCRHSCCIGWEIDIDEDSLARFRNIGGGIGKRLAENIVLDGEGAHFRLTETERCPFLNEKGLCDLILDQGENILCQICADHPRFRNFYSDREETGLGLCCEAAGRLILQRYEPARWVMTDDDGAVNELFEDEAELLDLRDELTAIAQDRRLSVDARVEKILEITGMEDLDLRFKGRTDFLLSLERLDGAWTTRLEASDYSICPLPDENGCSIALEQLLVYLLWRHLPAALDDDDLRGRIAFALFIWQLLRDMIAISSEARGSFDIEDTVEIAR